MGKGLKRYLKVFIFPVMLFLLSGIPMESHAHTVQNKDYFFTEVRPVGREETHYLEFVSSETYTVEPGDTLWDIAEDYWGKGGYYRRILSDNEDVLDRPERLMPGMELDLRKTLYLNAGIKDYDYINGLNLLVDKEAFEPDQSFGMKNYWLPYCIYVSVPYVNDLGEADPYVNWEEFKEEASRCSREVCGGRRSRPD